jgi:hypothetical protein
MISLSANVLVDGSDNGPGNGSDGGSDGGKRPGSDSRTDCTFRSRLSLQIGGFHK